MEMVKSLSFLSIHHHLSLDKIIVNVQYDVSTAIIPEKMGELTVCIIYL
jgi:hypothetical protein